MFFFRTKNELNQKLKGYYRYFLNSFWLILEKSLRIFSSILIGIWLARYLGPEDFGLYSYCLALVYIFGAMSKFGLDGILVRDLIKNNSKEKEYLGTAFFLRLFGSLVSIALISIFSIYVADSFILAFMLLVIGTSLIFNSFDVVEFFFQARVEAKIISMCKITQLLFSSFLKIYFIFYEYDVVYFALAVLFDSVVLAACYVWTYFKNKHSNFFRFDISIGKKLLLDAWPLALSSVSVLIYMRVDQIMINNFLGNFDLGIYSASVRISEAWYFIPTVLTASLFPAILNAKKNNHDLYISRLQNLYTLLALVSLFITLPLIYFSETIILTLFGSDYVLVTNVLYMHLLAGILVSLGVARRNWIISENLQIFSLYYQLAGMVINILLNLHLIPLYGIEGAAAATLFSQFLVVIIFPSIFRKTRLASVMAIKALMLIKIKNLLKNH